MLEYDMTEAEEKLPEKEQKIDVSKRIGIAKGLFEIPDDFDDIDISADFDGELFPKRFF